MKEAAQLLFVQGKFIGGELRKPSTVYEWWFSVSQPRYQNNRRANYLVQLPPYKNVKFNELESLALRCVYAFKLILIYRFIGSSFGRKPFRASYVYVYAGSDQLIFLTS